MLDYSFSFSLSVSLFLPYSLQNLSIPKDVGFRTKNTTEFLVKIDLIFTKNSPKIY